MTNNKEITRMEEKKPREAVVMLIQNKNGEVLFTKRSSKRKFLPGVWALPSGHVEQDEDIHQTAIRETKEELAIQTHKVKLIETIHEPSGDKTIIHVINIPADFYIGTPTIQGDEFEDIVWMKIENFYRKFTDEEIGSTLRYLRKRYAGTNK